MTVKDKLVLIKRFSGKTQEKIAFELGVSFATFNSWINGRSLPRTHAAKRIDEFYFKITGQNIIPANVLEAKKLAVFSKKKKTPYILKMLQARKDLYDEFLLAFTYNTNRIEGSTLTEPETAAVLFGNAVLADKSMVEQLEVKNHQAAFGYLVRYLSSGKK